MLSKKSSLLFSSYTSWSPLYYSHTSSPPPKSCRHASTSTSVRQTRNYASHAGRHGGELLDWPNPVHPHKTPTPYQILRCKQGDSYTKNHFYTLVKLYHPDRCHATSAAAQLPLQVRLERYRMLVAAHDILSDVEKRKAYDAWGHGWAGHHNTPTSHNPYDWDFDRRRWATDPRNNATWEDWERWHHDNDGSRETTRTVQMSNVAFVTFLFALVSLGGVMQGTRFNAFNSSVIERRDAVHRDAVMQLRKSKHATMNADREERVRSFLEHREAQLAGEESYHKFIPLADTCDVVEVKRQ